MEFISSCKVRPLEACVGHIRLQDVESLGVWLSLSGVFILCPYNALPCILDRNAGLRLWVSNLNVLPAEAQSG